MFKKLGIFGAVAVTALGLMQTSAFAAERNDGRGNGDHRVVVQNDRNRRDDHRESANRDRDDRRVYDRENRFGFRNRDDYGYGYGDQFWFRFGFGGDRDHDRDGR
ncbi:MAG TPA: hypothetical protein VEV17_26470 [Bryobacteraceae bacterium]|nr:hypothetical protein [Bryobacteraceae bacterium]